MRDNWSKTLLEIGFVAIVVVIVVIGVVLWGGLDKEDVSMEGEVVSESGISPSEYAVTAFEEGMDSSDHVNQVEADGHYELRGLPEGEYRLFIRQFNVDSPPSDCIISGDPNAIFTVYEGTVTKIAPITVK